MQTPFLNPPDTFDVHCGFSRSVGNRLGVEIELLHDVHERISPQQAVQLCKDVEEFRLFFLEDPVSPEDISYFRQIRRQCTTPLAMGELFNSPHEWIPLIAERLIDFIRIHLSQAGGLSPCRKIAALGELFGVRTAWHGPGDVSPIGHAANLALDLACYNFGIQEYYRFPERVLEVFQGCPEMKNGYLYANESPGWGIEVDEKAASRYPFGSFEADEKQRLNGGWGHHPPPRWHRHQTMTHCGALLSRAILVQAASSPSDLTHNCY